MLLTWYWSGLWLLRTFPWELLVSSCAWLERALGRMTALCRGQCLSRLLRAAMQSSSCWLWPVSWISDRGLYPSHWHALFPVIRQPDFLNFGSFTQSLASQPGWFWNAILKPCRRSRACLASSMMCTVGTQRLTYSSCLFSQLSMFYTSPLDVS